MKRTEGRKQKAVGSKSQKRFAFAAFCLVPSAFCSPKSAIECLLLLTRSEIKDNFRQDSTRPQLMELV
ncbi:MAG TPA: hypothetical protein VF791_23520 [Pyrinomonadaceae bacterium]